MSNPIKHYAVAPSADHQKWLTACGVRIPGITCYIAPNVAGVIISCQKCLASQALQDDRTSYEIGYDGNWQDWSKHWDSRKPL